MEKVKYTREEYRNEYLKSEEWKSLRDLIMSSKPDCQCCGRVAGDVHHMTYRNIVDIKVSDLLPVCRECHDFIHKAIKDGYISQDFRKIEEIKRLTVGILSDKDYEEFSEWINNKHLLSEEEIEIIRGLQKFVIKRISGLIKRNIWYNDLLETKFTGKQILKIREIIKFAVGRRKGGLDKILVDKSKRLGKLGPYKTKKKKKI